jgi:hypothetical protein
MGAPKNCSRLDNAENNYTPGLAEYIVPRVCMYICVYIYIYIYIYKVKQSLYTPWRRLGGEDIYLLLIHVLGTRWG